jgi:hypothetical protein
VANSPYGFPGRSSKYYTASLCRKCSLPNLIFSVWSDLAANTGCDGVGANWVCSRTEYDPKAACCIGIRLLLAKQPAYELSH